MLPATWWSLFGRCCVLFADMSLRVASCSCVVSCLPVYVVCCCVLLCDACRCLLFGVRCGLCVVLLAGGCYVLQIAACVLQVRFCLAGGCYLLQIAACVLQVRFCTVHADYCIVLLLVVRCQMFVVCWLWLHGVRCVRFA